MNRPQRRRSTSNDFEFQHSPDFVPRDMCFRCARPAHVCHCHTIPTIDNETELLLVQHIRERSHPFNTARMVKEAMTKVVTVVDYAEAMPHYASQLHSNAALLYPSKSAKLFNDLTAEELPSQLVVLDGTWHHAKRLFKCWPALQRLPHYRLAPSDPGRYQIRLEPDEQSLSTVEAVVAAYKVLEPNLAGMDALLDSFQTMIANQLSHPSATYERSHAPRKHKANIPRALLNDYERLVVAYGEAAPGENGRWNKKSDRPPVYWVAKRLATGEKFSRFIEPPVPIERKYMQHFELDANHFADSVKPEQFRQDWAQFSKTDDTLVVFNDNCSRMLQNVGCVCNNSIKLKSIEYDPDRKYSSLRELFDDSDITTDPIEFAGRAGLRIRNAITLVELLRKQLIMSCTQSIPAST